MKLNLKVALFVALGIGAVAAASRLTWRTAERPSVVPESEAATPPMGPAPAIAIVPDTPKPAPESAAQLTQEKQSAVAKPTLRQKRKKPRRRRPGS
jgi:hypothetical protein